MFDSPANRYIYEDALTRHDHLMSAGGRDAQSYRNGYAGRDERFDDVHEFWRAGVTNAFRHKNNM